MTEQERLRALRNMLETARVLAVEDDPVLDPAMHRVVAILHDALRLLDTDYLEASVHPA